MTSIDRVSALETEVATLRSEVGDLRRFAATVEVSLWLVAGVGVFSASWILSGGGGLLAEWPFLLFLLFLLHRRNPSDFVACLGRNVRRLSTTRTGIRTTAFFFAWFLLMQASEYLPSSSGSPPALVLFSITFIVVFSVPDLLRLPARLRGLATSPRRWLASALVQLSIFALLVVVGDQFVVAFTTAFLHSNPCRPVFLPGPDTPLDPSHVFASIPGLVHLASRMPEGWAQLLSRALDFAALLGEVPRSLPALVFLFVCSQLAVPERYAQIARMFHAAVKAAVVGGAISAGLKMLVHRYRPNAYGDPLRLLGPALTTINHNHFSKLDLSFPCGHATVTFAAGHVLAASVASFIAWNRPGISQSAMFALRAPFYLFPALVAVSRVASCVHWPSDAFFGSLLGLVVGEWVLAEASDSEEAGPMKEAAKEA